MALITLTQIKGSIIKHLRKIFCITFDTVSTMKSSKVLIEGMSVKTRGYHKIGDGGGAEYLITSGNTGDGYGSHNIGSNTATLQHNGVVSLTQFGAKENDLTYDSSPSINACIEYCCPYEWKGSTGETSNSNITNARIESIGVYRVDSPVLINPYLDWRGGCSPSYFDNLDVVGDSKGAGTLLIPYFTDKNQYVLDNAPYEKDGVRHTSWYKVYTNSAFDNNDITACSGINLDGVAAADCNKTGVFGGLRIVGGIGFTIKNCRFSFFKVPYFENVCWGHTYQRLHLNGYWAGFVSVNGTIGTDVGGMYNDGHDYQGGGANPFPVDRHNLPEWWIPHDNTNIPEDVAYLSAGLYLRGGSGFPLTSFKSPIIQGYERAVAANAATCILNEPYMEHLKVCGITGYWSHVIVNNPFVYTNIGIPFWDISGTGTYHLCNPVVTTGGVPMILNKRNGNKWADFVFKGIPEQFAKGVYSTWRDTNKPLYKFSDSGAINNTANCVTYYVSNSGSDDNLGFTKETALLTVDAALGRVQEGQSAKIVLKADETHHIFGVASTRLAGNEIQIISDGSSEVKPVISMFEQGGNLHPINLTNTKVRVKGVVINIKDTSPTTYWNAMFRCSEDVDLYLDSCETNIAPYCSLAICGYSKLTDITLGFNDTKVAGLGALTSNNLDGEGRVLLTLVQAGSTCETKKIGTQTTVLHSDWQLTN